MEWSASPEIFSIGPISIRWYGLLFALGFLGGLFMMRKVFEREGRDDRDLDTLLLYMIIGTTIGARLGHCLFYEPEIYLRDPIRILKIWEGGLASHGGTLGVLFSVWLFTKRYAVMPFMDLVDRLAIPTALVASMIRLGNLFNSEILGKPTDVPWAFKFMHIDQIPRHPAQLYESISYFILFLIMVWMYRHNKHQNKTGFLFGFFLIWVFGSRFIIEFFKEHQVAFEQNLPLDMGQLLSIPFVLAGIYLIWRSKRQESLSEHRQADQKVLKKKKKKKS